MDGSDVFYLPVTITNLMDESHGLNMFYYTIYGPDGIQLEAVNSFFMDDDVAWAGEMRSGATLDTDMHFFYKGDGDYFIEFDNWNESLEVMIPVTK